MATKISFEDLRGKLLGIPEVVDSFVMKTIEVSAEKVRDTAKRKFGVYQPSYGEFQGWAILNRDYVIDKVAAGAPGDEPLIGYYMSGKNKVYDTPLKDSIEIKLDPANIAAYVGTDNPLGKYQEFGTIHIPPRPFLRSALYENQEWIKNTMKETIALGIGSWFG